MQRGPPACWLLAAAAVLALAAAAAPPAAPPPPPPAGAAGASATAGAGAAGVGGPAPGAAPPPAPLRGGAVAGSQRLSSRTVRTKYGDVSGVIVTFDSRRLEPVEVFRGIPYASPPVGNLRFMPPVTGARWTGVKVADRFAPVCPQRLPDVANETAALRRMPRGRLEYLKRLLPYLQDQSEDCLFLNIYAPAQAGAREASGMARYPVLVFVHGESYEWNSGNPYDGSVLASYASLVVVTINYRLGILGFLNPNTDAYQRSPANYGLMDQIAALHWLQENIAVFGGDPTNVTIVGHGTGAACVNLLMTSGAVPDGLLFHRAVLMSGAALAPWALVSSPARHALAVARHANCSPSLPLHALLRCLRDRPLQLLMSAPVEAPDFSPAFGPSVDGVVVDGGEPPGGGSERTGNDATGAGGTSITDGPEGLPAAFLLRKAAVARLSRYDLLQGVVKAEAYFAFSGEDVQYGIEADRRSKILRTFVRNTYRWHLSEILATIVNEYTDWERPVQHPINIRDETLEALSDAAAVAPAVRTADLHSAQRRNSFLYVFDYQTKFGDYPQRQGCIHGEELPYILGAPLVGGLAHFPRNYTKAEVLLAEATMIYWSNFARTGNPNEPQEPEASLSARGGDRNRFRNIEWTAYESVHKKYLNLDTKPKVKSHYRAHRLSFWLNLVPDLHRPGGDDVPATHHQLAEDDGSRPPPPPPPPVMPPRPPVAPVGSAISGIIIGLNSDSATSPASLPARHEAANFSIGTSQSLLPPGAEEAGAAAGASAAPPPAPEDGFAAYSTALSVTIAIGCSLLILNVLIFAGVYYQRDKTRLHAGEAAVAGDGRRAKKRSENGQMPNSICGELLAAEGKDPHRHRHHHQLPPPEFADLPPAPAGAAPTAPTTRPVPCPPPPPPKVPKAPGAVPEAQPLLPPHPMPLLGAGALAKKGGGGAGMAGATGAGGPKMEELRV